MLTQEQLIKRRQYVGASEIGALLGQDKFKTAVDVYRSKINPPEPQKETPAIKFGNALEFPILKLACDELKTPWELAHFGQEFESESMLATLDAKVSEHSYRRKPAGPCIIEAKTTGFAGPPIETWGRAGTEDIPERVLLQVQFQMEAADIGICWIALLSGHDARGLSMYRIKRQPILGKMLRKIANRFIAEFVNRQIEPPPFPSW